MDKHVLEERIARNRRNARIHKYIYRGMMLCIVLAVLIGIAIVAVTHFHKKAAGGGAPVSGNLQDYEKEQKITDISGAATWIQMTDEMKAAAGTSDSGKKLETRMKGAFDTLQHARWIQTPGGKIYTIDGVHCYAGGFETIGGQNYHFSVSGYVDVGWTAIGGKGHYFDANGIEDPSRSSAKLIALTFDDGPGPHTGELLDVLEQTGARATFFMVGSKVDQYGADTIPRMVKLGCMLGNHSYDHPDMKKLGVGGIADQFGRTDSLIAQYSGGASASAVRFPYGSYTDELKSAVGHPSILWNTDTTDWKSNSAQEIINNVLNTQMLMPGELVLMHDIQQITVDACKTIIPELIKQGYELVTVRELAASKGYELENGVTYYGFTDHEVLKGRVSDKVE